MNWELRKAYLENARMFLPRVALDLERKNIISTLATNKAEDRYVSR